MTDITHAHDLAAETGMSTNEVLLHRLALAVRHLKWTPPRVEGFLEGHTDSLTGADRVSNEKRYLHLPDVHGFDESSLDPAQARSLGYDDGVRAAEALSLDTPDYFADRDAILSEATQWSANGNGDFEIDDASWSADPAEPLDAFLRVMSREQWISWFVQEHEHSIEAGCGGYGHLLMQDIRDHVVWVDYPQEKPDVWDGWHRIGASMLKGAGRIPAIKGVPAPEPTPTP